MCGTWGDDAPDRRGHAEPAGNVRADNWPHDRSDACRDFRGERRH
jgi:hypothetical protein